MAAGHNTWTDGKQVRSPTFNSWRGMVGRCRHPSHPANVKYGELGICARWEHGEGDLTGFDCFLADMGERPSRRHTLDRIENKLGYSKDNCRWATLERQARNRSITKMVTYNGETMALADAYEQAKPRRSYASILWWLWKGYSFEDAIIQPDTKKRKGNKNGKTKGSRRRAVQGTRGRTVRARAAEAGGGLDVPA